MSTSFVKLGSCVKQYRNEVWVDDSKNYGQITVSSTGTISHRGTKSGAIIGRKRQFVVDLNTHPNTLIFTRQGIYDGAIGFAPSDTDGCIATENMPMFSLKSGINREYMEQFLLSAVFKAEVKKLAPKGAAQKSVHERVLLEVPIPLPPIETQIAIATSVAEKRRFIRTIQHEIAHQESLLGKLKQAILQEAIQGKLTADWRAANPDTEPASELLKRIQKEKLRRIADKKLRKEKPLPKISPAEIPFEIPKGWEWCRMGNIYTSTSGGTPARTNTSFWDGSISWLKSGEMTDDYITEPSEEMITELGLKNSSASLFPQGTLLIAMYGATAGKLGLLTYPSTTNQAVCGLFTHALVETRFAFFYLRSQRSKMIEESWGNSQPNISQGYLRNYLIPLPPLAEQVAIVERVEALMETCRALETEIEHSRTHAAHLLQAVLKEAFSPAS